MEGAPLAGRVPDGSLDPPCCFIGAYRLQEPDANLDSPVVADFNHLMSGEIDMDTAGSPRA